MRASALLALTCALSSCCVSLPKMPQIDSAFAAQASVATFAVDVSRATWRDDRRQRDVPVTIYKPIGAGGRRPVVVFSHGIGEDRDSYAWFGQALAAAGYIVVIPTHAGMDKAVLRRGYWKLYQATKNLENWRNRPLDVSFVLDRLSARDDVDMDRVAVAGHSAGAFTAFALAGVRGEGGPTLRDERVRAIVPMSMPKIPGLDYDDIRVPVLNITGTCDSSIIYRTRPRDRRVPFERAKGARQYLATIEGVNHDTFSNAHDRHHDTIVRLTIDFLRAWLSGDDAARARFDHAGLVTVGKNRLSLETN